MLWGGEIWGIILMCPGYCKINLVFPLFSLSSFLFLLPLFVSLFPLSSFFFLFFCFPFSAFLFPLSSFLFPFPLSPLPLPLSPFPISITLLAMSLFLLHFFHFPFSVLFNFLYITSFSFCPSLSLFPLHSLSFSPPLRLTLPLSSLPTPSSQSFPSTFPSHPSPLHPINHSLHLPFISLPTPSFPSYPLPSPSPPTHFPSPLLPSLELQVTIASASLGESHRNSQDYRGNGRLLVRSGAGGRGEVRRGSEGRKGVAGGEGREVKEAVVGWSEGREGER